MDHSVGEELHHRANQVSDLTILSLGSAPRDLAAAGDRPRRALHSYFTRRANGQQLDQKKYVRPQTLARLGPAARFILDLEEPP